MRAVERLQRRERLGQLARKLAEQEGVLRTQDRGVRLEASQLYRAVLLAQEEHGRAKVAELASHQVSRATIKPHFKEFWKLLGRLARGEHEQAREYLGDRPVLDDDEFRVLLEFLVVETLYARAVNPQGDRDGRRGFRRR